MERVKEITRATRVALTGYHPILPSSKKARCAA